MRKEQALEVSRIWGYSAHKTLLRWEELWREDRLNVSLKHFPPNGINGDVCSRDNGAIILGSVIFLKQNKKKKINTCELIWSIHIKQQTELQGEKWPTTTGSITALPDCILSNPRESPGALVRSVLRDWGQRLHCKKEKTKSIGWNCSKKGKLP